MAETNQDRAIGRMEGALERVLSELQDAKVSRKQMYEKLDALDRKVESTETTVEAIDTRLKKVEEPVAEFSRWRERFIGMWLLITFISGSVVAGIIWLWQKAMAMLSG